MPAKIKTSFTLKSLSKDALKALHRRKPREEIADAIVEEILYGRSPVQFKRFEQYSRSYAKQKYGNSQRRRPVNMLKDGDMLNSFKVLKEKDGLVFRFDDEKADWHNNGKGRLPKRRLLPTTRGERFKPRIMKQITKIIEAAVNFAVKKQNRKV